MCDVTSGVDLVVLAPLRSLILQHNRQVKLTQAQGMFEHTTRARTESKKRAENKTHLLNFLKQMFS